MARPPPAHGSPDPDAGQSRLPGDQAIAVPSPSIHVRCDVATDTQLKRAIGPRTLTLFMLGYIVGAGIYVLVGTVAQAVGGAMWVPFVAALVLSLLTASS